jgi:O-antigen ligase
MKAIVNVLATVMLLVGFYLIFGKTLAQKGYDPIEKVTQIAEFALDKNNPDWDKGRSLSRKYALDAWEKNPWIGVGYDDLSNYGLPEGWGTAHNFVITSIFHRGIIGTFLYLLILFLLYRDGVYYWITSRKEHSDESNVMKLLIIVTFSWLIVFWTQEIIWEKYAMALQLFFMGLISNYYKQPVVAAS